MWGYPSGGRGKNIQKVLDKFERLKKILKKIQKDNQIDQAQADLYISELDAIDGLGMSTWSKFLYFFKVSASEQFLWAHESHTFTVWD